MSTDPTCRHCAIRIEPHPERVGHWWHNPENEPGAGYNVCLDTDDGFHTAEPEHGYQYPTGRPDYERIPGVTRHCSVCGIVVGRMVKGPDDLFGKLETTEAWGVTPLPEYRCKNHTHTEEEHHGDTDR